MVMRTMMDGEQESDGAKTWQHLEHIVQLSVEELNVAQQYLAQLSLA